MQYNEQKQAAQAAEEVAAAKAAAAQDDEAPQRETPDLPLDSTADIAEDDDADVSLGDGEEGALLVNEIMVEPLTPRGGQQFVFRIVHPAKSLAVTVAAKTQEEYEMWMSKFEEATSDMAARFGTLSLLLFFLSFSFFLLWQTGPRVTKRRRSRLALPRSCRTSCTTASPCASSRGARTTSTRTTSSPRLWRRRLWPSAPSTTAKCGYVASHPT